MKNALIIGESNSVMHGGWVQGFIDGVDNFQVINRSIGSTGLLNVIHQIVEIGNDILNFDVVIFDHMINDLKFYRNNKNEYFLYLDALYAALLPTGVRIYEILYSRHDIDEKSKKFLNEVIEFLKNKDIEIYDVKEKLLDIKIRDNVSDLFELYKDSAHPQAYVSYELGTDIAKKIKIQDKPVSNRSLCVLPFEILNVDFFNLNSNMKKEQIRIIKNSIVDYKTIDISLDMPVQISVPFRLRGSKVIGFMFNSSKANGFCSFKTLNNDLDKIISNNNFLKKSPILWARPLHKEFLLGDLLTIECKNESSCYEDTEFCAPNHSVGDVGRVEIVSLILMCS